MARLHKLPAFYRICAALSEGMWRADATTATAGKTVMEGGVGMWLKLTHLGH
jgi:hypothetical protein